MEHNRPVSNKTSSPSDGQRLKLHVSTATHKVELAIRRVAGRLIRDFADLIVHDPASFKQQVVRLIRRELPPWPGRPNDPRLDAARSALLDGKAGTPVCASPAIPPA